METDKIDGASPSAWVPCDDPVVIAILGKAMEEAGELVSALARCLIQGIDETDPATGKPNAQWLAEECADVAAGLMHVSELLQTDANFHITRAARKFKYLGAWHQMIRDMEQ